MKQRSKPRSAALRPPQPVQTLPCWHKLPSEQRQATIIALTAMMVKWLPERRPLQEGNDV
jgi:hypothetical protein